MIPAGCARTQQATSVFTADGDPWLIVLIGVPGSGKSSFARATWDDSQVLSLDALRGLACGDPCNQDATREAVMLLHLTVHVRLRHRMVTVVDATNVTARARKLLLDLASRCGVPTAAVIVTTPLPTCLARNRSRPGPAPGSRWGLRVPEAVIREQHALLGQTLPGLKDEGFAGVFTFDGTPAQA